jgi:hypothetical protein
LAVDIQKSHSLFSSFFPEWKIAAAKGWCKAFAPGSVKSVAMLRRATATAVE